MLKLFLIRHGEAEPAAMGQTDHSRVLTARGKADILALQHKIFPAISDAFNIVCSTAVRTLTTAALIGGKTAPLPHDSLYNGDVAAYLQVILRYSTADHLVVVGHNPVISWLAAELTGGRSGGFMPGTCAEISYEHHISDPTSATPVSVFIHHPPR